MFVWVKVLEKCYSNPMKTILKITTVLAIALTASFAHAAYDANGYDVQVLGVKSRTASVKISRSESAYYRPVSIEYYLDGRGTSLKQGTLFIAGLTDMPSPYLKVSAVMSSGSSNYFVASLLNLEPNSVYQVRYSLDNNYCAPGTNCTLSYTYPTVGPWMRFETLSEGRTPTDVLTFGSVRLQRGSTGIYVANLQNVLNKYAGANLYSDGNFGLATKAAVQAFQMSKNMTTDGVVGAKTKAELIKIQEPQRSYNASAN